MKEEFFKKLTDEDLIEAFKGDEEWFNTKMLTEDNPLSKLCDRYELETNVSADITEITHALLYEMASRFYQHILLK